MDVNWTWVVIITALYIYQITMSRICCWLAGRWSRPTFFCNPHGDYGLWALSVWNFPGQEYWVRCHFPTPIFPLSHLVLYKDTGSPLDVHFSISGYISGNGKEKNKTRSLTFLDGLIQISFGAIAPFHFPWLSRHWISCLLAAPMHKNGMQMPVHVWGQI